MGEAIFLRLVPTKIKKNMEIMYGCTGTCNHPAPCNFAVVNIKVKQNVVRRFNREKVTAKVFQTVSLKQFETPEKDESREIGKSSKMASERLANG